MIIVDFRSFEVILFNVVAFLGLIRSSCLSISDKPASLWEMPNGKLGTFFNLLLISKTLGWFLYLSIAFSTELISLLSVSIMKEFSFISKPLVTFSKNLLNSSETKWSSKVVFSLLSIRVISLLILRFFREERFYIFQKLLLSLILLGLRFSKYFSALFLEVYCSNFFIF